MLITIQRYHIKDETTDGQLFINGRHLCDTAEHTPTSLPPGTYPMEFKFCGQYSKKMLFVTQNQNCSKCLEQPIESPISRLPCHCPMIKPGNGVYNRNDGSIIIGIRIQSGIVLQSGKYFDRFYECIRKAAQRGKTIKLEIINP